jgi:Protein of unknown function (DUF1214)
MKLLRQIQTEEVLHEEVAPERDRIGEVTRKDTTMKTTHRLNLIAGALYDGKSQLLIKDPINRYLINSPMLPNMKKNADGSLTLYIQKDSPGADKESNWLPSPNDTIYLAMRLYWPKETPPSILPPGEGTWKPPGIVKVK